MSNKLIESRKNNNFTQEEAAKFLGVSLRSYKSYEIEEAKQNTIKYKYFVEELNKNLYIDEDHGILTIERITEIVKKYWMNMTSNIAIYLGHMQRISKKKIVI